MADSVGNGFPNIGAGIEKGHLLYNLGDGITYQWVGGPVSQSSSWRVVFGDIAYAQLVNVSTIVPADTNLLVTMFQAEGLHRISLVGDSDITIQDSGVYAIVSGGQCDKTGGGGGSHFVDMWIRKNGVDIPNTGVRNAVIQLAETKVLILNWVGELLVGDVIQHYVAVNNAGVGLGLRTLTNTVGAVIPAIIFTIVKIRQ